MEVICLHDEAFYLLIEKVVQRIKEKEEIKEDEWINTTETMRMLRIKSKATLQKLRNEGQIEFSKTGNKTILYKVESINHYLAKHIRKKF